MRLTLNCTLAAASTVLLALTPIGESATASENVASDENTSWTLNRYLANGQESPWNAKLPIEMGPGKYGWFGVIRDKQFVYFWVETDSEGVGRYCFHFSNGLKFDGDNFRAAFVMLDKAGNPQKLLQWSAGMNGAGISGGAKERTHCSEISGSKIWWASIGSVKMYYGDWQKIDDGAFWDAVASIAETLLGDSDDS